MPPKKIITYTSLLHDIYKREKDIDSQEVLRLLRQAESIPRQLLPFNGIIHVIDYTQRRHVALSGDTKNMMGYDSRDVIKSGLEFVISIFQKDDFKIYNEIIFGQAIEFLRQTPQQYHNDYLFSYSYRMRKANGKWMQAF